METMMVLYDEEEVMRSYAESEINDAILDAKVKITTDMIRGMSLWRRWLSIPVCRRKRFWNYMEGGRNKDNGKEYFFVAT